MHPFRHLRLGILLVALGLAGCAPSPTSPSHYAPFTQTDLQLGAGAAAASGNSLTVHYTLWLYNEDTPEQKGAMVETSAGGDPLTFVLGAGTVIEGWNQGLAGMQPGGVRRLVVPPSLGYGPSRNNILPPNATLLFEVELIEVDDTP